MKAESLLHLKVRQLTKSISDKSRYVTEVKMSKGKSLRVLVSLVIIAYAGNLQLVTSSEDDSTVADFYNETTVSRIAFGSCR